ncbi:IPTL-CTERM sorting domain-containing protein [Ottowia sp. VDI28]|uniref:IPTL-CTERM sorting domain-containing protein n=1 Tax=Ottowia sp. VDI28 TaxID=3133968 RepID=UPI003C2B9F35
MQGFGDAFGRWWGAVALAFGSMALSLPVHAQITATSSATADTTCVGNRFSGSLNCTANDFGASPSMTVLNHSDGTPLTSCTEGDSLTVDIVVGLSGTTGASRENGGLFFGQVNNDPSATTAGNICSVAHFPGDTPLGTGFTSPTLPGNVAGGFSGQGSEVWKVQNVKVQCVADTNGKLKLPYAISWRNSEVVVTGDTDPNLRPDTRAKCSEGENTTTVAVVPPTVSLTLQKSVNNRLVGQAQASAFGLMASGPVVLSGAGGASGIVPVGTYTLSESTQETQYTPGAWSCNGGTLNGNQLTLTSANPNTTCTITNTHREADLQVTKTSAGTVIPGQAVTWTITATNTGPDAVTNATIADDFPAGVSSATWSASATGGATGFSASGSGNISNAVSMPVGSTITYTVVATINPSATGSISNTVTISPPADTADPNTSNNTATNPVTLTPSADLMITKSQASPNPAIPGQQVTWNITVQNNGPSAAATSTAVDTVPASVTGLTFGGAGAGGVCSGSSTVTCNFGALNPGDTRQYTITGTLSASATGNLNNTATVSSTTADPNMANNTSSSSTPTNPSSLVVSKTNNLSEVVKGNIVSYTVTIQNTGGAAATGVSWTDNPTGLTINSIAANSSGTCTPAGCTNVTVNANSSVTFTVSATVTGDAGTQAKNMASVTGGGSCTVQTPCSAEDSDPIVAPDISVTKSSPQFTNGSGNQWTATYIVTVANTGSASGTYTLSDTPAFASGVTLNSWTVTTSGGTVNPALNPSSPSGQVSDAGVTINKSASHTYTVTITYTTSAAATALTCNDSAGNGAFNTASITGSVTASASSCGNLPAALNLTVAKTSSVQHAVNGNTFTYTITASNVGGPVATTNPTTVVDTIPSGITVTAVSPGAGFTCTPSAGLPLAGNGSTTSVSCTSTTGIAANASNVTVAALTVKKTSSSDITNTAVATAGDPRCTGSSNPCQGSVTVTDSTRPRMAPIPTLGEWALGLLAALMAGLSWRALRRLSGDAA